MGKIDMIRRNRAAITIVLAIVGIGLVAIYAACGSACRYLKGSIVWLDLKWIGIVYMLTVAGCTAFGLTPIVRSLLATGIGAEVHLYAFQVANGIYCPFCLAFSLMVITAFVVNYELPSVWRRKDKARWLYILGEVNFPMVKIMRLPLLFFVAVGYLFVALTFSGSVTPAYGAERIRTAPSLGKGQYEVLLFTDYFCPPCKQIDTQAEALMKELLASGQVKIIFVDVPVSRPMPIYARYFLYALNASPTREEVFRIRAVLFAAAQQERIEAQEGLVVYLKKNGVRWVEFEEREIFQDLNRLIREHQVDRTPTAVIRCSPSDVKKYIGVEEIWEGLNFLKTLIEASQR